MKRYIILLVLFCLSINCKKESDKEISYVDVKISKEEKLKRKKELDEFKKKVIKKLETQMSIDVMKEYIDKDRFNYDNDERGTVYNLDSFAILKKDISIEGFIKVFKNGEYEFYDYSVYISPRESWDWKKYPHITLYHLNDKWVITGIDLRPYMVDLKVEE